jgi:hypothetical protein
MAISVDDIQGQRDVAIRKQVHERHAIHSAEPGGLLDGQPLLLIEQKRHFDDQV